MMGSKVRTNLLVIVLHSSDKVTPIGVTGVIHQTDTRSGPGEDAKVRNFPPGRTLCYEDLFKGYLTDGFAKKNK